MLHHSKNASIQFRQIQCMKDQMQVSHVDKGMAKSSKLVFSQSIRSVYLNQGQALGLTLSIPCLVEFKIKSESVLNTETGRGIADGYLFCKSNGLLISLLKDVAIFLLF